MTTMVEVFREVKRVLRDDGTVWLNLGDSYCASPPGKCSVDAMGKSALNGCGDNKYGDDVRAKRESMRNRPTRNFGGLKPKDLIGIPWRVAFALQADGWYLRSDIVWAKGVSFCPAYAGSVMPESVTDRPTKSHEYLFLLTKSPRYYYDADAVREASISPWHGRIDGYREGNIDNSHKPTRYENPDQERAGRNLRSVWTINPQPYREAHFATFPTTLVEPCVKAGSKKGDTVLDPFAGSGTTGLVAGKLGREFVGIELNPDYIRLANERIEGPLFARAAAW